MGRRSTDSAAAAGAGSQTLVLEDFLAYRIRRLADAVSLDFSRIYRERYGLTRPEWRALATLGQFGTTTATAIGVHSAMHKTKVSRAVAELEKRRWLTRSADPEDRRLEHLALTKAGLEVYRELVPLAIRFEAELLQRMAPADRSALLQALAATEAALGLARPGVSSPAADSGRAAARDDARRQAPRG
jgi:DNA-binding MarR family transcriptional regulator